MGGVLATATLAVLAGACGVGAGAGAVDGALYIRECSQRNGVTQNSADNAYSYGTAGMPEAYSMRPSFFAADPIDDFPRLNPMNRVEIRVQSSGSPIEQADVMYLNIASVREVAVVLGQPVTMSSNSNVRATLELNQTCPQPEVAPTLEGTITFTSFGTASSGHIANDFDLTFGDRLTATFQLNIVDVRAAALGGVGSVPLAPAVGGDLTGFFDFVIRRGQSEQAFP